MRAFVGGFYIVLLLVELAYGDRCTLTTGNLSQYVSEQKPFLYFQDLYKFYFMVRQRVPKAIGGSKMRLRQISTHVTDYLYGEMRVLFNTPLSTAHLILYKSFLPEAIITQQLIEKRETGILNAGYSYL